MKVESLNPLNCKSQQQEDKIINYSKATSSINNQQSQERFPKFEQTAANINKMMSSQMNSNSTSTTTQQPEMNSELRIIIIDENWSQYCYRIKINTPFGKLINRFCQQVRKADNKSVLFWYHGRLVEDEDTPKTLNIKDNEVILAHYIK